MTIQVALDIGAKTLMNSGIEGPRKSAEILLCFVTQRSKKDLIVNNTAELSKEQKSKYLDFINRRAKHEPVWYITGEIEFYEQTFLVNENTLIPRPETEIMMEIIAEFIKKKKPESIIDIGTGSGAIILTLAAGNHGAFYASDISKEALKIARKNAVRLGIKGKVTFKKGDLFQPWANQRFDFVVANLPYIPHEKMSTLAPDLIHYEPAVALDGGAGGLDVYTKFFMEVPEHLAEKGIIICEVGYKQGSEINKMVKTYLPEYQTEIVQDYSGEDRVVIIHQ